jgi:hypothetical protein
VGRARRRARRAASVVLKAFTVSWGSIIVGLRADERLE